jgi:hypothetical protein
MTEALSALDQIAMSIDQADDRADVDELKRLVAVLESMDIRAWHAN